MACFNEAYDKVLLRKIIRRNDIVLKSQLYFIEQVT